MVASRNLAYQCQYLVPGQTMVTKVLKQIIGLALVFLGGVYPNIGPVESSAIRFAGVLVALLGMALLFRARA